jgi:putative salt-induced outer membrane protein
MTVRAGWLMATFAAFPTFACAADGSATRDGAGDASSVASTAELDPGVRMMIETAIAKGDEATVKAVLAVARQAAPANTREIDVLEQTWRARMAAQAALAQQDRLVQLHEATPFEYWKGEVELGVSRSTGTTSQFGLLGSLDLKRTGIAWSHELSARAEVQSTNGQTTTERLLAAWQPHYHFAPKAYAYGLLQYEHDPLAGYDNRYALGAGLGVSALEGKRAKLELEGGPALRHVDDVDGTFHTRIAGRASLNLDWRVTPTLSFTQKTSVYLEGGDGNVLANTALDTKLIGNLKARLSYNLQYERNQPIGTAALNTQSRVTFVYGF